MISGLSMDYCQRGSVDDVWVIYGLSMEYLRLSAHYLRIDYVSPVSTDLGVSFVCRFCASLVSDHMDSLWTPSGYPVDSRLAVGYIRAPCEYPMDSLWIPYEFLMDFV